MVFALSLSAAWELSLDNGLSGKSSQVRVIIGEVDVHH